MRADARGRVLMGENRAQHLRRLHARPCKATRAVLGVAGGDRVMTAPRMSVLIVNYKAYRELSSCLESLRSDILHAGAEAIVVDNASDSASLREIREIGRASCRERRRRA